MKEEIKNKILKVYETPVIRTKRVVIAFARQTLKDVKEIEEMKNQDLIDEWTSLVWINDIYGQVSLNELQRIDLIEAEMDIRTGINKDELKAWYDENKEKIEIIEALKEIEEYEKEQEKEKKCLKS